MNLMTRPMRWIEWEKVLATAQLGRGCTTAVGFALGTWSNGDGSNAYPGYQRLADGLGISVSSVDRAMTRLESLGWITRENGSVGFPGHAVHWQLSEACPVGDEKSTSSAYDNRPDHLTLNVSNPVLEVKKRTDSPQPVRPKPALRRRSVRRNRVERDEGGNPIRLGAHHSDRSLYGSDR